MNLEVHVADYSHGEDKSYLHQLETLSQKRNDGGLLHGGHIHFIQGKLSDEDGVTFLKAAIAAILDATPTVFPYDLPEQAEKKGWEPTPAMEEKWKEINRGLLLPIQGYDIIRVLLAAREYEKLDAS